MMGDNLNLRDVIYGLPLNVIKVQNVVSGIKELERISNTIKPNCKGTHSSVLSTEFFSLIIS
jgi:hypothetical protein